MKKNAGSLLVLTIAAALCCTARAELPPEELSVNTYPALTPHRIHVVSYEGGVLNRYYVIDGDSGEMLGLVPGGYNSVLRIGPDGNFYSSDTYYEKIWRGKRTDQITVTDGITGNITKEIEIPPIRQQSYAINAAFDFTEGGRYLLQYNMTPAGSVTVVDPQAGKVLAQIPSAGCGLVYPYAPMAFAMLCGDGGMLRVSFNEKGEVKTTPVKPFFDSENDPLMQNGIPVPEKDLGLFVSYEGMLHELDLAGPKTYKTKPWSLRSPEEGNWWPSGWQPLAYSAKLDQVYVLMSDTVKWDHTSGGSEIWAFDRKTHKRLYRYKLEEKALAIAVSPDADAQLYALSSENDTILYVIDAAKGELLRQVDELGSFPFTLMPVPAFALKP